VAGPAAGGSLDGTPAPARRVPAMLTPASLAILAATLVALGLRVYFQYTRPGFLLGVSEYDDGPYYGSAVRLVHGVLPYRDFVMVQPPGIALLMSPVALLTGGHTAWGLADARVLTVAASGAGVVLAGLLVRHRGALAALVTCGLVAVSPDSVAAAHTVLVEPWLTLCCLAGAVAVFDGDRLASSRARLLAGGAAFGFGGAVEAWAVVPVLVVAVLLLPGLRRAGLFLAGVAAGFGVPVLPFAVIAPGGFYRSVIVAQLGRVSPARAPVWSRLADMIGMVSAPPAQRATVLAVAAGIAVAVLAAVTLTWLASREPPPALDRFALATTALVVALFCWADQFYYHFVAFLAPFAAAAIGLTLSRLLAARRPGSSTPAGQRRWPRWVVTTVAGLGIVVLAAGQARAESGRPRVIGAVPHAVDRVIPPGACVLTDQVTITLLAGRFLSGVPGCPVMVDSLATDLALSGGRRPAEGAGRVPAVAAVWRQAFQHAQYLLLTHNNPGRIPWTPALRAYASRHFLWVPLRWNGVRLYVRSGLPHPRDARQVAPATF
jgi:alpha-1,2-mannosyltransferase